ncbi:MAG: Pimeloyl-ACP methyl ester carboxylesterase [Marmoricola sp.]|nr:Pimeloyl-ACP methyl ester carboxylesterase [Marmoricola sp.]
MSKRRSLLYAAGGIGAAVLAAAATGVAVERRVVRARRAGGAEADRLGTLRSDPQQVKCDDGVVLHAEVDEISPYAGGKRPRRQDVTVVFVHGYALNLDCWHFQREAFRGSHRMAFYDQRSHGRSERSDREHANIDQLGDDLADVIATLAPTGDVILVGHSMGGMSIIAFAERHPEMFAQRVTGVALISTTAGGLQPHRTLSRWIPDRVGQVLAPRVIAAMARAPELVDSARRPGSNVGFLVADMFAFGGKDVPAAEVEFLDEMLAGTSFDVLAQFFPSFSQLDKFEHLAAFAGIETTIICGTKDRLTSIDHSRKMAEQMPGARLVEVVGAGHMVIFESRDVVNAALQDLVEEAAG